MHSGLLGSIGLAGLLLASPVLAADGSGCQGMKADKPCCAMPCCQDNTDHKNPVPATAKFETDATDIFLMAMQTDPPAPPPMAAPAVSASAEFLTDPFFLAFDTAPPVAPVVTSGRATPTIR